MSPVARPKNRVLGISLGDANGIGPEIALRAAYKHRWPGGTKLVLVGDREVVTAQARAFKFAVPEPWNPQSGTPTRRISCWNPTEGIKLKWEPGKLRPRTAAAAAEWIRASVEACQNGTFDAMTTGPISKEGFQKAGLNYPGHTEMLAELTGTKKFAMMLLGGDLRVLLVTRHMPLARVPGALNRITILEAIRMAHKAMPWLGCRRSSIGVCGLNPHAGDGGVLGREEITIIRPAIHAAQRLGIKVQGPIPSDTIFYQAINKQYDAVVAMYHDQGLGPLKMLAFDTGINLTLGLPIIRTSPDHGTAFDLAGRGKARESSMVAAMKLALQLAAKKNPWASS